MKFIKNSLFALFLGVCLIPANLMAQKVAKNDSITAQVSNLGIHPYKKIPTSVDKFANWSLTLEVGFNLMDGDYNQPGITIAPMSKVRPSAGLSLTYDFTPTWALTGVYTYANYGVKDKDGEDVLKNGHMHSLELLLSYDLADAWFTHRQTNIFSLYLLAGVGMGFYNSETYLLNENTNEWNWTHPRSDGKYDMVGMVSVGLAAEFNVTRELGLGLKGMYHIYTSDLLDGKMKGTMNDCMEYASIYARWKLEGRKKNHMRNFSNQDDVIAAVAALQAPAQTSATSDAKKDTVVVYHKDTVVIIDKEIEKTVAPTPVQRHYVYFDNDRSSLNDQTLAVIQQFADLMQEDTTLCVELSGYCDNTGSEKYNETLAQKRAERVKKELVTVYGISEDRIVANGKGMLTNVGSAYAPNRRVAVRFISKEECDQLKAEKDNKSKAENKPVAIVEEQTEQDPVLAVITTKKDITTLSRLARRYYGNAIYWPYIYEANTSVLPNPDFIPEGVKLTIPRLTAEQTNSANKESVAKVTAMAAQYQKK